MSIFPVLFCVIALATPVFAVWTSLDKILYYSANKNISDVLASSAFFSTLRQIENLFSQDVKIISSSSTPVKVYPTSISHENYQFQYHYEHGVIQSKITPTATQANLQKKIIHLFIFHLNQVVHYFTSFCESDNLYHYRPFFDDPSVKRIVVSCPDKPILSKLLNVAKELFHPSSILTLSLAHSIKTLHSHFLIEALSSWNSPSFNLNDDAQSEELSFQRVFQLSASIGSVLDFIASTWKIENLTSFPVVRNQLINEVAHSEVLLSPFIARERSYSFHPPPFSYKKSRQFLRSVLRSHSLASSTTKDTFHSLACMEETLKYASFIRSFLDTKLASVLSTKVLLYDKRSPLSKWSTLLLSSIPKETLSPILVTDFVLELLHYLSETVIILLGNEFRMQLSNPSRHNLEQLEKMTNQNINNLHISKTQGISQAECEKIIKQYKLDPKIIHNMPVFALSAIRLITKYILPLIKYFFSSLKYSNNNLLSFDMFSSKEFLKALISLNTHFSRMASLFAINEMTLWISTGSGIGIDIKENANENIRSMGEVFIATENTIVALHLQTFYTFTFGHLYDESAEKWKKLQIRTENINNIVINNRPLHQFLIAYHAQTILQENIHIKLVRYGRSYLSMESLPSIDANLWDMTALYPQELANVTSGVRRNLESLFAPSQKMFSDSKAFLEKYPKRGDLILEKDVSSFDESISKINKLLTTIIAPFKSGEHDLIFFGVSQFTYLMVKTWKEEEAKQFLHSIGTLNGLKNNFNRYTSLIRIPFLLVKANWFYNELKEFLEKLKEVLSPYLPSKPSLTSPPSLSQSELPSFDLERTFSHTSEVGERTGFPSYADFSLSALLSDSALPEAFQKAEHTKAKREEIKSSNRGKKNEISTLIGKLKRSLVNSVNWYNAEVTKSLDELLNIALTSIGNDFSLSAVSESATSVITCSNALYIMFKREFVVLLNNVMLFSSEVENIGTKNNATKAISSLSLTKNISMPTSTQRLSTNAPNYPREEYKDILDDSFLQSFLSNPKSTSDSLPFKDFLNDNSSLERNNPAVPLIFEPISLTEFSDLQLRHSHYLENEFGKLFGSPNPPVNTNLKKRDFASIGEEDDEGEQKFYRVNGFGNRLPLQKISSTPEATTQSFTEELKTKAEKLIQIAQSIMDASERILSQTRESLEILSKTQNEAFQFLTEKIEEETEKLNTIVTSNRRALELHLNNPLRDSILNTFPFHDLSRSFSSLSLNALFEAYGATEHKKRNREDKESNEDILAHFKNYMKKETREYLDSLHDVIQLINNTNAQFENSLQNSSLRRSLLNYLQKRN